MSFGKLNEMLSQTIIILESNNITKKLSIDSLKINQLKEIVFYELINKYSDITKNIIDEIFVRLFAQNYNFNKSINFNLGKNCFREFEESYPDIKVPIKYKKLNEHFNKLKNLPQPAQRSQEWYDYRFNRITASDMASAIDLNPYEPIESFILKKCDPNFPFRDNATVFHGKKYEPTATMIYEHIYNTRVFEFGALPSEKYSFLGASPDGICSKYTLDNKFSDRLGTMLEIKCPVTRDIHTKGKIEGDICPFYYYCQVQQQLVCCELDVCDFWQCKLIEYKNRSDYLSDDCDDCSTTHGIDGTKMDIDNRLKKGIILEFYPRNFVPEFEGDLPEWKSKYIIPKRLDMDSTQYDGWTIKMMDQYKKLYPDINKDYYFYRIIYWKLEMSHNVAIKRDDKFFANVLPILEDTWAKILYYRANQDKLPELKLIADKRKKYVKMNLTFMIHNDKIIKNKYKFLEPDFDCKKLLEAPKVVPRTFFGPKSTTYVKKQSNDESICDSSNCDFIDDDIPLKITESKITESKITNIKDTKTTNITESKTTNIKDTKKTNNKDKTTNNKDITPKKLVINTNITNITNTNCDFID